MDYEDYVPEYFDEECYEFNNKITAEEYDDYDYNWSNFVDEYDRYADTYEDYYDDRW